MIQRDLLDLLAVALDMTENIKVVCRALVICGNLIGDYEEISKQAVESDMFEKCIWLMGNSNSHDIYKRALYAVTLFLQREGSDYLISDYNNLYCDVLLKNPHILPNLIKCGLIRCSNNIDDLKGSLFSV